MKPYFSPGSAGDPRIVIDKKTRQSLVELAITAAYHRLDREAQILCEGVALLTQDASLKDWLAGVVEFWIGNYALATTLLSRSSLPESAAFLAMFKELTPCPEKRIALAPFN